MNNKSTLKVSPLHSDDRNPAFAHVSFNPGDGGDMQFMAIPKDRIHDVVLALLNTHDALNNIRDVESVVTWENLEDKS